MLKTLSIQQKIDKIYFLKCVLGSRVELSISFDHLLSSFAPGDVLSIMDTLVQKGTMKTIAIIKHKYFSQVGILSYSELIKHKHILHFF